MQTKFKKSSRQKYFKSLLFLGIFIFCLIMVGPQETFADRTITSEETVTESRDGLSLEEGEIARIFKDRNGVPVKIEVYNSDNQLKNRFFYREDGTQFIWTSIYAGNNQTSTRIEFDENGKAIKHDRFREDGSLEETAYYDENGHVVKEEKYNENNQLIETVVFYRDPNGRLTWRRNLSPQDRQLIAGGLIAVDEYGRPLRDELDGRSGYNEDDIDMDRWREFQRAREQAREREGENQDNEDDIDMDRWREFQRAREQAGQQGGGEFYEVREVASEETITEGTEDLPLATGETAGVFKDADGVPIRAEVYASDNRLSRRVHFRENGKRLVSIFSPYRAEWHRSRTEFNENGKMTRRTFLMEDGRVLHIVYFDDQERGVRHEYFNEYGELNRTLVNYYDENGRPTSHDLTDQEVRLIEDGLIRVDEYGRPPRNLPRQREKSASTGKIDSGRSGIQSPTVRQKGGQGNTTTSKSPEERRVASEETLTEGTDDITLNEGETARVSKDTDGVPIRADIYNSDDELVGRVSFGENGRRLLATRLRTDGEFRTRTRIEYDENGKKTKRTSYRENGNIRLINYYDENENIAKIEFFENDKDNELNRTLVFYLDADGNSLTTDNPRQGHRLTEQQLRLIEAGLIPVDEYGRPIRDLPQDGRKNVGPGKIGGGKDVPDLDDVISGKVKLPPPKLGINALDTSLDASTGSSLDGPDLDGDTATRGVEVVLQGGEHNIMSSPGIERGGMDQEIQQPEVHSMETPLMETPMMETQMGQPSIETTMQESPAVENPDSGGGGSGFKAIEIDPIIIQSK